MRNQLLQLMGHPILYSQVARLFNAKNSTSGFISNVKLLMEKLCYQNFNMDNSLHQIYKRFCENYKSNLIGCYSELLTAKKSY